MILTGFPEDQTETNILSERSQTQDAVELVEASALPTSSSTLRLYLMVQDWSHPGAQSGKVSSRKISVKSQVSHGFNSSAD